MLRRLATAITLSSLGGMTMFASENLYTSNAPLHPAWLRAWLTVEQRRAFHRLSNIAFAAAVGLVALRRATRIRTPARGALPAPRR